jgi:hypothetical protein
VKIFKLLIILLFSGLAAGCMTMQTPPYEAAIDNYEQLQQGHYKNVSVGDFTVSDSNLNQISVRGNPLKSSINDSFGTYLKAALEQEFYKAGLLAKDATCIISGALMKNDIDAAVGTASGYITAKVIIEDQGAIVFDKVLTATHEWPSNFVGAVAIPRARDNYPLIVRAFIKTLVEDADFKTALKN